MEIARCAKMLEIEVMLMFFCPGSTLLQTLHLSWGYIIYPCYSMFSKACFPYMCQQDAPQRAMPSDVWTPMITTDHSLRNKSMRRRNKVAHVELLRGLQLQTTMVKVIISKLIKISFSKSIFVKLDEAASGLFFFIILSAFSSALHRYLQSPISTRPIHGSSNLEGSLSQ